MKVKLFFVGLIIAAFGVSVFLYSRMKTKDKVVLQNETPASVQEVGQEVQEEAQEETVVDEKPVASAPTAPQVVNDGKAGVPTGSKATEAPAVSGKIVKKLVSFGFQTASSRKIDTIIIHSTYNALGGDPFSVSKIVDIYKSYGVAPHYLIDRSGTILQLVEDKNIAYHAGEAKLPDGRTDVNGVSIGIEMINSKTEKDTDEQYAALSKLLAGLKSKYNIKYVLGHKQIAPGRKDDPWNFDWDRIK